MLVFVLMTKSNVILGVFDTEERAMEYAYKNNYTSTSVLTRCVRYFPEESFDG